MKNMSASKQKKVRTDLRSDGVVDKKTSDQIEAEKKRKKFRRNTIIAVVIIVLVIAASILINSKYFYTKSDAVTVDGTGYTAAEYDYYYKNAYYNFVSSYGNYISFFLDTSKPLTEQKCSFLDDENATWADYFSGLADDQLKETTALYSEAQKNGYVVDGDYANAIENNISSVKSSASSYGYTVDAYLALNYGKGMDLDTFTQVITKYYTALGYGQTIYDSYSYDDSELDTKYAEIKDDYDRITYLAYLCPNSLGEYEGMSDDEKAAASHDAAQTIADAQSEEEFVANVESILSDDDKANFTGIDELRTVSYGQNVSSSYSEWMLDSSRKTGDTYVADASNGSYAVMFISRDDNSSKTVNVRHILVTAEADDNGDYTEEALAAAKAEIEDIEKQWKENPTEERFAELAGLYSDDTGSNAGGGLYENVYNGQMVEEFNDFCFDPSRKPGDTAIVYGSSSSYAGYHLIYFIGDGPIYSRYLADNVMRQADYTEYLNGLTGSMNVTHNFAFRFVNF